MCGIFQAHRTQIHSASTEADTVYTYARPDTRNTPLTNYTMQIEIDTSAPDHTPSVLAQTAPKEFKRNARDDQHSTSFAEVMQNLHEELKADQRCEIKRQAVVEAIVKFYLEAQLPR